MVDKIIDFLINKLKLNKEDIIVIGNSGGPDSMALTDILLKLRKNIGFKIVCAHVNHNVRVESDDEEKFLKGYCDKNDIPFEHMKI